MSRQERQELERHVQSIEREFPKWSAAEIERELSRRSPIGYGNWKDETPLLRSRLRAVQRWRWGSKGRNPGTGARHLFPYLWPIGDRQRKELEPDWLVSPVVASGSWRIFLYNCSPEVVRDVRVHLDRLDLDYSPALLVGRCAEVHWQRIDAIKSVCLSERGPNLTQHLLEVDFVIARGTRQARVEGELSLDTMQGWTYFDSRDGRHRDLE
ncbi:MAG: hypothetical protein ACREDK_02800 [Thermoplasmata archaeon]